MNSRLPQLKPSVLALKGEAAYKTQSRADELEAMGRSIIRLEIGQPDFAPPPHVIEATHEALRAGKTRYTHPLGLPELRRAVAEHVSASRGVAVTPEMVGITPSVKTAIFLCMGAVLEAGDEAIYPDPGYPTYGDAIRFYGAVPKPLPFTEKNGFDLDLAALKELLGPKTKLLVINSPSNPLGSIVSRETLAKLPALFKERGASPWVLSDEIYSRLVYDGATRAPSVYSIPGMQERTFLLDGFSKIYAMTGWRLGFVIFPEKFTADMDRLFVNSFACVSTFVQYGGVSALTGPQDTVFSMVKEFEKRRNFIVDALNGIPGVKCEKPSGAFYVFPNIKKFGKPSTDIAHALLEEVGVALLPGDAFGAHGEGHLRISYANSIENLKEGVRRLGEYLRTLAI